jgi:2-hydroxy-3-keto-5-methylthiopentenyl-1-phosphate phosphatase
VTDVVLCDFDGTLTDTETMELIYRNFASCGMKYADLWSQGKLSTIEEITAAFATISASREEIEVLFDGISLLPGAVDFLQRCQSQGSEVAVASDGLRWYIDHVLMLHGLSGLRVYANSIYFEPDGFRFSWPWYDPGTPLRSSSKAGIIRRYQRKGLTVSFIGNGESDTGAIGVADRLYARGWLAEYCERMGAEYVRFTDFRNLLEKWG